MTSLVTTLTETLRYRGAIGQWSWVLHRITGLGVVLFLTLHVVDTSWAYFYPDLYAKAIAVYQTPLFTIGEFVLIACVVYHALNGLRIGIFDARPELWKHQAKAAQAVILGTILLLIPVFILMFGHVLDHYNTGPFVLGLDAVIEAQIPFIVGIGVAGVAAVLFSAGTGAVFGDKAFGSMTGKGGGSKVERFWWSFMRISGLLIVPLVFGHLAMMHIIQGVFDLTMPGYTVVGTNAINVTGTATEFVAHRWNFLFAGVAIWRIYDWLLLGLVVLHGFNGLRYVLTDYTMGSPLLRRAAVYLCTIGAVVLLVTGGGALLGTIDSTAIEIAHEATCRMNPDFATCDADGNPIPVEQLRGTSGE